MATADPTMIWYASYGSNCSRPRFLTYLRGGRPEGADRDQIGARDASDPLDDQPVEFATSVCFAGHASRWGGAPAFLEHAMSSRPPALGRRYLITCEQFADVLAQESGRPLDSVDVPDLSGVAAGERVVIGDGFYDAVVLLDPVDGVPCVSFTSPTPPESREPAPPSEAYLRTIVTGLAACHDLPDDAIVARLLEARGMRPTWDVASITALLA
jgi:hypothetical protein